MSDKEVDDPTPAQDDAQSSSVARINRWCKLSELSAEGADEYERERFSELISKSMELLPTLTDPFYSAAARHSIVNALCKAQRFAEATKLVEEIDDEFILERVLEDNPHLTVSREFTNARSIDSLQHESDVARAEASDGTELVLQRLSDIEDRLSVLESELSQRIASTAAAIGATGRRVNLVLWLLVATVAIVLFK